MAFEAPNLAPFYSGTANQLENRANLELKQPSVAADVATPIIQRIDTELTKQRDFEKKLAGEGRSLFTSDMATELSSQLGVPPETFKSAVNRYYSPKEMTDLLNNATVPTGMAALKENVGTPNGLTQDQFSTVQATGEKGKEEAAKAAFSTDKTAEAALTEDYQKGKLTLDQFVQKVGELKAATMRPFKSKDSFGRDTLTYPDGTVHVLNGASMPTQPGQLANQQAQLHPAELKTFKDGLKEFDTKTLKDSKQAFLDLDKMENAIRNNNPVAFFNTKIQAARLGGISANRLAQGAIVQEAGARDFYNQVAQKINTFKTGQWTDTNKNLFLKYVTDLKSAETQYVQNQVEDAANTTLSSMPDPNRISPDFIKREFTKPVARYLKETAPQEFKTLAEAEAANLAKGTKITIGGRPAVVE